MGGHLDQKSYTPYAFSYTVTHVVINTGEFRVQKNKLCVKNGFYVTVLLVLVSESLVQQNYFAPH